MIGVDVGFRSPHKQKHLLESKKKKLYACFNLMTSLSCSYQNLLILLGVYLQGLELIYYHPNHGSRCLYKFLNKLIIIESSC